MYRTADHRAPSYDEPGGIRDLLKGLEDYGWQPVVEGRTNVIAMSGSDGSISLEPAGQFELSGAPLDNLHLTCAETGRHLEQVKTVGDRLGLGFLGLGMWPDKTRAELPIMPKGRYAIMLRHMPRVGSMGLDMMLRTCTIQTNLDYGSEADMAQEVPGVAGAAAARHRAVREFAVPGGQAQRLPQLSQPHLVGHRPGAAPACCRSCSRTGSGTSATPTMRSMCRCTSSTATGRYIDAAGLSFRDFLKR